jgi:ubiquinone/menaquinone biosynthesis C-methylase UbiE
LSARYLNRNREVLMAKIDEPAEVTGKKRHLARIFSLGAPTYDRVGPRFFSYFGRRLVEMAKIPPGATVLDIASGRGAVLFPAAEAAGDTGQVTGIDLSEGMVQATARDIENRDFSNAEIRQMDAEYLKFANQTFDVVLIGFAIFFFPQLDHALSEFYRVLKPAGRIAWTTFHERSTDEWAWFGDLVDSYLDSADDESVEEDAIAESEEPEPVFDTVEGVEAIMTSAGFTDVVVESETADFIYSDEEEFWDTLYSHGMRASLERIEKIHGQDGLERFKNELFVHLQRTKGADGIHQGLPVLYTVGAKPE